MGALTKPLIALLISSSGSGDAKVLSNVAGTFPAHQDFVKVKVCEGLSEFSLRDWLSEFSLRDWLSEFAPRTCTSE